jgi:ADP-heptose:LPS heptosyltransferase
MPKVSPSVLIIRLDAIGDALALTPLLAAFREGGLPVDIVLARANAGIFTSLAARRIVVAGFAQRSSTRSNLAAIERLGDELHANGYSHVLVATEDPGGYRLAAAVGAPVRIGFVNPWGKPLKALWTRRLLTHGINRSAGLDRNAPHECEVLFRLGEPLLSGENPTRDLARLRPLVLERDPPPDERIAVQVTNKWERLGIAFEHVVAMIRRVAAGGTPRLLSARNEATYAQQIADATGTPVEYFDEIGAWKKTVAAAPAIVAPDSAAIHVAGMIGTPVVAVFPPQRGYALQIARWAPWAAPHRIVRADHGWPARVEDALAHLTA